MTQPTARRPDVRRIATTSTGAIALAAIAVGVSGTGADAAERYTVRAGDTVSHIALRTGTSVASIARANSLADVSRIHIGQVLSIPTSAASASHGTTTVAKPKVTHTVRAGETVSAIAHRYGTTVSSVVAKNHLDSRALIRIGQVLTISGGSKATSTTSPKPAAKVTYTVRSGDTVGAIATSHGTTVAAIVKANGLGSRALIRIGQVLTLPGASTKATSTPSGGKVPSTFAGRTYSEAVVGAANANKATLERLGVPSKAEMQRKVVATARKMGLDPALAQAIAYQESGFNHTSVSPANAIGVMQVIPSSGEWASDLVGRHLNLLDPDDNVTAGVAILRSLVRTSPDVPRAIAGYYQGASSVRKYGMFADTRRYVANVQTLMTRFG